LLLRFVREEEEGPGLSAWVVGAGLDDVPQHTMEVALRGARAWTERDTAPGFFADLGGRGR